MEYDVTGTLKIDTEAFEKALKEAQSKIDSFRKDLESLGNIAKEMGFPELKKSLDNVDKSLDDIKVDFGKVDKSADNVTESVEKLKKETDNATKNVKSLKNEIKQVAEEGNKVDESFEKTNKRIDELKSNLKSAYKELKNLRNEQNKIGERYSKAQKKNTEQFTYAYDFYKKGDYAKYEKEMEGYHKQEAELSKKFRPLYQDVNERIKKNREQIEQYKSEIDKLEESLERIPNSFDKIIEASKNAGQSVRDGLLKELQKSEEKLASLYKNFEKATTKIRDRPLLAHEKRDDVIREEIDKSPQLKKMNDEIKRQKWYIEDLLKEWDKLGEPSAELDKKISKIERWTAGIREAEVELAKLRTSAEDPKNFYSDSRSGYYAQKELDSVMETLSKYDKPMEKINTRMKELKAEFSQLLDVPSVSDRNFERIRAVEKEMDKLYKRADNRQAKISKEVNEHLNSIAKEVEKSGKGMDNVTKSAENLKQATNDVVTQTEKAGESAKELDNYFDQATNSVKKTSTEVNNLQRRIEKLKMKRKFFNDFYSAVRFADGGDGIELKPVYDKLKKDYKGLVKSREEFEKLFTMAVEKTNTRLYPSRNNDINVKFKSAYDKGFGYIDRKQLISYNEYCDLMDKSYAKIKQLNTETNKTPTAIEKSIEKLREASSKWDELRDKMNALKSKGASESEIEKATAEYEKQRIVVKELTDAHNKLLASQKKEGKQYNNVKKGTSEATKDISEFDRKLKEQFEGLDAMVKESAEQGEAQVKESVKSVETTFTKGIGNIKAQIKQVQQAGEGIYKFFRSNANLNPMGKWMPPQMYTQPTNRWVHEQLSTTRDFFKGFTQGFARLKKEQGESVTWMNELHTKMEELRYGSRDFINTQVFAKAKAEAEKYMTSLDKMRRKLGLIEKYQYQPTGNKAGVGFAGSLQFQEAITGAERYVQELRKVEAQAKKTAEAQRMLTQKYKPVQFNQYGAGFLGDANIQKDIQLVNEFHRTMRNVSASTNQWVNEEITQFNRFSQAVQKNIVKAREEMELLHKTFMSAGNKTGVGFAGSTNFQAINKGMQEYNRLSNLANLNTNRMGLGFEKFGQYSQKATSSVRSLSGVLRTLRTTMSMIGGMFVWEFAFRIMDSAKATISAKSEMESYYKTLNMGSTEIASFNKQLDNTVSRFQKMNKFQLGETISALGVEFKMSTEEMNQIMKVAPMIVNEYLRAGRSTEEAILAIKDISQGEFLRLSRETGVGGKEIKEAGWSGDNKDILSLYQALEKIGTARHWDVFASKAQSLNDVMLITENRMTEFVTLLSDAVTPVIVGSFNAMGSAFNGASQWYESLAPADKVYTQLAVLGTVALTTAGVFNNHLLPAIQNFGTNIVSSFLGVDSAIVKEKGLAQAIAHETAVERIANIERKGGQKILHSKIMTLKAEELANKLGMSTTKLRARYENLQTVAINKGKDSLKAKELAQRSLILAEEQNITTTQAMTILLEEEALAEMGSAKALLVKKFGLDATIVSEEGMVVAMNERIAQSIPYVSSLVSQTFATLGLESATATLVVTMGLLLAPFVALGLAIAPLIVQFAELQASYQRVNDVLTGGQDRIDALTERKKELQKTEEKLASKTNRTTLESQQLDQTRKELTDTTDALKLAEEELNKAQGFEKSRKAYVTQLQANRYRNVKEINSELQKATGTNDEIISQTIGMDKAYADMTRHMQVANYMENHRAERFEELNKKLKESSSNQEEYNRKVKEFGNDWNQAYTDMESAQEKMADPSLSGWDRFMAQVDFNFAEIKKDWIEFWADPFAGVTSSLGEEMMIPFFNISFGDAYNEIKSSIDDFTNWLNTTATDLAQAWDNFWKPITDFFNGQTVDSTFDPFAGIKEWWGNTNDWLESLLPDISVDSIKNWFGKNIREPFQKAFRDWMKNPFGGGNKDSQGGGTATKSISLGSLFKFDFAGFKTSLSTGLKGALGVAPAIFRSAGDLWSRISNSNGAKTVQSVKQGLAQLGQIVTGKFNEGENAIVKSATSWGKSAYSTGSSIYSSLKNGIGDLAGIVRNKFKGILGVINSAKKSISGSVKDLADTITAPFNNIHIPFLGGGSFGYGRTYGYRSPRARRVRVRGRSSTPVYGSGGNLGFESVLRTMLTSQGFRSPSSYQFYPNHQKTTQEAWDSGKANCFDGASLILALGSMFGLKGHLVMGEWNGTGHTGAVVGGKLYDMTQFQRRGVFRGTSGVHFGSRKGNSYGTTQQKTTKVVNINVTNDLSNATIYGIDDLDNHIKKASEKTYYELNSVDGALGY